MKKGLTLSETLLTLLIVGVIMTLTIPILYTNISESARITTLHKLYTALNTDIETVLAEAGSLNDDRGSAALCEELSCLRAWGNENTGRHNGVLMDSRFFKVRKICTNCFEKGTLPFGDNVDNNNEKGMHFSTYILNDYTEIGILDFGGNCNQSKGITYCEYVDKNDNSLACGSTNCAADCEQICEDVPVCSIILIDVNGEKEPNEPGVDRFAFYLADEKIEESHLIPFGYSDDEDADNECSNSIKTPINDKDIENYYKTGKIVQDDWKPAK